VLFNIFSKSTFVNSHKAQEVGWFVDDTEDCWVKGAFQSQQPWPKSASSAASLNRAPITVAHKSGFNSSSSAIDRFVIMLLKAAQEQRVSTSVHELLMSSVHEQLMNIFSRCLKAGPN
jgi:hypothetical protein